MTRSKIALTGLLLVGVATVAIWSVKPAAPPLSHLEIVRLQVLAGQAHDGAAEQRLRAEARSGAIAAQVALGQVLIARPLADHAAEGMRWLHKASATGNRDAQAALGKLYFHGAVGVTPDYAQALGFLRAAAERNDAGASCMLALMYKNGLGVAQDSTAAARWFEAAVLRESPAAMFLLANMILSGDGVRRDEEKARRLIERAAALEYPEAVQMMAMGLRDGSMGFERDEQQAAEQILEIAHAMKHRPQDSD